MTGNATSASVLRDGLNTVVKPIKGWNYYAYYNPTGESDMMNKVQADIGGDHLPMVFLVDARKLPSWHSSSQTPINHYVEGYGYESTTRFTVSYADSYSGSSNYVGDHTSSQSQMWTAISSADNGAGGTIAVIL